jgi:hypothetical protein
MEEDLVEKVTPTTRIRGGFSQTSKGVAQLDITSEATTAEEMRLLLADGMDAVMGELTKRGIPLAHKQEGK